MDLSVLPNNNHPDKFLQLEVKSLVKNSTFLQARLANFPEADFCGEQQWHNRVYSQVKMIDRILGKHITPVTLKSTLKSNPLYNDIVTDDSLEERKKSPSWTVEDYDKHSLHSDLASYLKENPNDLQFWMENPFYTPGYDTLLKKKEREKKQSKCWRIVLLAVLVVCLSIVIVTVCILFT
uniref:Membrane integral NOTCH2 associated receptor 2 n=1 Tax=Sphenodon punctatus TaxID=8508 RepID=A0A8D0HPL2_SPHPU